jgi:hypothetical protein
MTINPFEGLAPVGGNYARLPLLRAFNWADCLADQPARDWYVVAFRSIRNVAADPDYLKLLDDLAYEEAQREPGLLLYFRGTMTDNRECLSICIWEGQAEAEAATRLSAHRAAADITDDMYDVFELERWLLVKRDDTRAPELLSVSPGATTPHARRRSARPLGSDFLVDFDKVIPNNRLPHTQETDYAQ